MYVCIFVCLRFFSMPASLVSYVFAAVHCVFVPHPLLRSVMLAVSLLISYEADNVEACSSNNSSRS